MSKIWKGLALFGALGATALITTEGDAAGQVTTTKDDCISAWAILMPSHPSVTAGFRHPDYMEAVQSLVKWRTHWNPGGYEAGVSQKFSLCNADLRFNDGGTAIVAHCGHGATCNELAREVLKSYPEVGNPVVYCSQEPPVVLGSVSGC